MKKVAFITGITGQDGAYLAELLLKKDYIVHGLKRRSSSFNTGRIDHLYQDPHVNKRNFILHHGDLTDSTNLIRIIQEIQPDEIYNLAAQSHVQVSFETPEYTANADGLGTLRILEAIRLLNMADKTKFIRHLPANFMVWYRRSHKTKKRRFIRVLLMLSLKSMVTGLRSITVRLTIYTPATESSSTMSRLLEEKHLSPEK